MKNINLNTPINSLGYGHTGMNVLLELSKLANVALWPIGPIECEPKNIPVVKQAMENAQLFDYNAPSLKIWHQHDMSSMPGRGTTIGWPIFELDTFTDIEKHHLAYPDKLFVCSEWAKAVITSHFLCKSYDATMDKVVKNIFVVPLGVDSQIFFPTPITPGPTVFCNIGKWEVRKGHDVLIRAFKEEFKADEKVKLLLCCTNPFLRPEQAARWTNQCRDNKNIHLIPRLQSHQDVADLIRTSDCGVFPARAEGWNMEALETLACGRHLIITDYSAHKMYSNTDNARLISVDRLIPAYDEIWPVFHGQGNWANLGDKQVAELRKYMREIHTLKSTGKLELNQAGIDTANKLSWANTAQTILENI